MLVASQRVVPVVMRRAEPLDGGMADDHPLAGPFTRFVSIEAAVDLIVAIQERTKPRCRRTNTGG